jgi:hypothetical protein
MIFEGEALGRNILGTPEHISLYRETMNDFISKNYSIRDCFLLCRKYTEEKVLRSSINTSVISCKNKSNPEQKAYIGIIHTNHK